jgi:hypothetical protein
MLPLLTSLTPLSLKLLLLLRLVVLHQLNLPLHRRWNLITTLSVAESVVAVVAVAVVAVVEAVVTLMCSVRFA